MVTKCPKCDQENPPDSNFCKECGTRLIASDDIPTLTKPLDTPLEELTRGTVFADRYKIIEELGLGGMGKVYRVEDIKINEDVALKLIRPEIASDRKTIERFRHELKIARKIAHRNVCKMFDLGEDAGTHYITMEYVTGEDLKSLIKRVKRLDVATAVTIAKQICEGLSEAHSLGIIHRDLKPSNIMIDKNGNARIMDFGIARSTEAKEITDRGIVIGTPEYLSPEQAETKEVDQRSDLYSLGVILYEMATGKRPFEGETALSVARKHVDEIPRNPKEINPQIPDDLNGLIVKCMEKAKEKRFQSAEAVLSELENIEEGIPTKERVASKKEPKTVYIGEIKWKNLILYGGATILIIILIIFGISLLTGRQQTIESIAVLPLENLTGNPSQEYFSDGITDSLISELGKISSLRVISRTSVMPYKKAKIPLPEIAQELNVDAIVEGSVMQAGAKVEITVKLIEALSDRHLWGNSYERNLSDVLALRKDVAREIVKEIKVKLTAKEEEGLASARQVNPKAYEAFLKGDFHWHKFTPEGFTRAREHYEAAIKEDPDYAPAYSRLAQSLIGLGGIYGYLPPKEGYPQAKAAVQKALNLDNTLGEAYTSLGFIKFYYDWDWSGAEHAFKKGIELNPNFARGYGQYALLLAAFERFDEALKQCDISLEIDPLSMIQYSDKGWYYFLMEDYDKAIQYEKKAIELDPDFPPAYMVLGQIYLEMGMLKDAINTLQKGTVFSNDNLGIKGTLGLAYAKAGKREKALEILDELEKLSTETFVPASRIALIYGDFGDNDKAFQWLDKAYEYRDFYLAWLKVDPKFGSLRTDPRFTALLKKMNMD